MSTAAKIIVKDDISRFVLYQHHDGDTVKKSAFEALKYAWPLPRFDAAEFATAYIATVKPPGAGHIYLVGDDEDMCDYDYCWVISSHGDKLIVELNDEE